MDSHPTQPAPSRFSSLYGVQRGLVLIRRAPISRGMVQATPHRLTPSLKRTRSNLPMLDPQRLGRPRGGRIRRSATEHRRPGRGSIRQSVFQRRGGAQIGIALGFGLVFLVGFGQHILLRVLQSERDRVVLGVHLFAKLDLERLLSVCRRDDRLDLLFAQDFIGIMFRIVAVVVVIVEE